MSDDESIDMDELPTPLTDKHLKDSEDWVVRETRGGGLHVAAARQIERALRADLYAAAALLRAKSAERAWLVEWKAHGYGPQWWGFNYAPGRNADWCADANKAIRFSRREDAERMRLHIIAVAGLTGMHDYERSITATEHEWPDADNP